MPKYKKIMGFMVVVNVCTRFVSVELLRSRQATELVKVLKTIIKKQAFLLNTFTRTNSLD